MWKLLWSDFSFRLWLSYGNSDSELLPLREILGGNDNVVLKYRHFLSQVALFQAVLA